MAEPQIQWARDRVLEALRQLGVNIAATETVECFAAELVAVRREAIEECALVIEAGQETHTSSAAEDRHHLSPRHRGNLAGLAYATAVRALADKAPS